MYAQPARVIYSSLFFVLTMTLIVVLRPAALFAPDGTIDFSGSAWKSSKAAQNALSGVRESMLEAMNVETAHIQKQVINETGKLLQQQKLLTSNMNRVIGNAKSALISAIDDAAPGYRPAVENYAVKSYALTEFEKLIDRKSVV
jgi:hypothetical protein